MTLHYHGTAVLAAPTLALVEQSVNAGYAFWLEAEPGYPNSHWPDYLRNRRPMAPSAALMVGDYAVIWVSPIGPESGSFLGFRDEHDRDIALHVLSTRNMVRLIHPFSNGRGLYSAEAIVNALLGSEAMRLSVMGTLGDYQRLGIARFANPMSVLVMVRDRELGERLLSTFRGGLEAAPGAVRPEGSQ